MSHDPLFSRRRIVAAAGALCVGGKAAAEGAGTGGYPSRPVRLVIPFPPGGSTDVLARDLGSALSTALGQPVFIDNRAGAGGLIGNDAVAKAHPDGYTLLLTTSQIALAPALYAKLSYDAVHDLIPILRVVESRSLLVTSDERITSLKAYVELARSSPGAFSYATPGIGTAQHVFAALFGKEADISTVHVPYKGSGPMLTDLLAKHIGVGLTDVAAPLPHVQSGKLKALAINGTRRIVLLPDVPTFLELGYKGFDVVGWYGFFAPARTPPEVIARLRESLARAMLNPGLQERIARMGLVPLTDDREDFGLRLRNDMAYWKRAVDDNKITVDE